jgi:1-acyl-sn-glycerol-3-phosphate acyltransferase
MELRDSRGRHAAVWALTRPAAAAIMAAKFNFHARPSGLKGPLLVVANHNSDWDPGFIVCAFREQMYFVASEHLMRLGTLSRLLSWLQAPIARQKGGSAVGTVREMLRRLRGIQRVRFPGGQPLLGRRDPPLPAAIGRLARVCRRHAGNLSHPGRLSLKSPLGRAVP